MKIEGNSELNRIQCSQTIRDSVLQNQVFSFLKVPRQQVENPELTIPNIGLKLSVQIMKIHYCDEVHSDIFC